MGVFDILFIILFLAFAATLLTACWVALRGRFRHAWKLIGRLLLCVGIYMAVVVSVSFISPRKELELNAPQCFDDWCIAVTGFERHSAGDRIAWNVTMNLFSRARRATQRENNLSVYFAGHENRRFDPIPDASAVPFNVRLEPGESVGARRSFLLPKDEGDVGLVITHEGGFPIGWFIIGYDTWFRKPAIVPLK